MSSDINKKIKSLLGHAAGAVGMLAQNVSSKMIVVTFHRVNDWMAEDGVTCHSDKFEKFCAYFQSHFKVVPLADQIVGARNGKAMGGTLSITFDDGYRDNFEIAAPILRRFGLPATFFVTTGFLGTDYIPVWDRDLPRHPGWMDWNAVRALRDQYFDIGAHTHRHIDLGTASSEVIRNDLAQCRAMLQAELGESTSLFAYPFGGRENISPVSMELVREAGFQCCVSSCGGVNAPDADPFQINRINVGGWFLTPHQFGFEILSDRV